MSQIALFFLACSDFITGALATPHLPALMWAVFGLIMGGAVAFCLEAPVYGLRTMKPIIVGVPLLAFILGGGILRAKQKPIALEAPAAPPPVPPPAPNFAGVWDTGKWGSISMVQDAEHVFGNYTYAGGVLEGTTSPDMAGRQVLRFRWRNQSGGSTGVGYFSLSSGGQAFEGRYTEGENLAAGAGQDWSGTRTAPGAPPANFTGVWNTEWGQMTLNQGVTRLTGTYAYGGGLIVGNVSGKTLNFRWTNRVTGQSGKGQFILAIYGASFAGSWSEGNAPLEGGQPWTGTRVS